jgi:hypothetical protein
MVPRLVGEQELAEIHHDNGGILVLEILRNEQLRRGQVQNHIPNLIR